MEYLSIEAIVARYMAEAIKAIENKRCTYCAKGKWRVVTICVDGRDMTAKGFRVDCAVQCSSCRSEDAKNWRFSPFGKIEIVEVNDESKSDT